MPGDAANGSSKDEPANPQLSTDQAAFLQQVEVKAARKLRAQRRGERGVWFGLGMSGLIGWSVAVPTLLGAMLGIWLDRRHPGKLSWTLALLVAGLAIGSFNAWHWLTQEQKAMHDEPEDPHE
jgi:ATP synthase protein I